MPVNEILKIMHWNAQSITNISKQIELQLFLHSNTIDILLLNETFLKPDLNFKIPGYRIYRHDRESNGGGVAIVIKNSIRNTLLKSVQTSNIENIAIEIEINKKRISIISVYSPNFNEHFKKDLLSIIKKHKEFFIFGDLNAKHRSWNCVKGNAAGNVLYNMQITSNFFVHHSASPTRFPQGRLTSKPSTIDLLLTNSCLDFSNLTTHEHLSSSDHVPVMCTIHGRNSINLKAKTDYSKANWAEYKKEVANLINRTNINSSPITFLNINFILNKFIDIIKKSNDKIPKIQCQTQILKLSQTTKMCIKQRNRYRRRAQRTNDPNEKAILKFTKKASPKIS